MLIKKTTRLVVAFCLVSGVASVFCSVWVSASGSFRMEGRIHLPGTGQVTRKLQIRGPEIQPLPGAGEDGLQSLGNSVGRSIVPERNRGTYSSVEMKPLVFVQLSGHPRFCLMTSAPKGEFALDDIDPGNYKLTIAVPDLGWMEKWVEVSATTAESCEALKLEFDFSPPGEVIGPVSRKKISGQALAAFEMGAREFSRGNLDNAENEFRKAVETDGHYAEAWEYIGIIQRKKENLEKAEECFRRCLNIDSNSYWALQYQGAILLFRDDLNGARELFEKAVMLRPGDPYPRTQLGTILFRQQKLSEALGHLVKARAADPRHFSQPQIITAEVFRILKDRESVAAELNDFIENFPDDPKVPAIRKVIDSIPWQ